MLVLTRGKKQRIQIGDDVIVTILTTGTNRIRVGIEAPRSLDVKRLPAETKVEVRPIGELSPRK